MKQYQRYLISVSVSILVLICISILIPFIISLIFLPDNTLSKEKVLGFDKSEFIVVKESDSHGGFLGDGEAHLILDCSENSDKAREIVEDWNELPLSKNVGMVMYGGEHYGYRFAEKNGWPKITNGVYKFVDRHREAGLDKSDDTELFNRASFNFTLAIYDFDTDFLYYFKIDT